ncbi:MAG: DUF2178 domain-containing protein [Methanoregulaceae archaeon]
MNKNTFYIVCGIVALINVLIFWVSVIQDKTPIFIQASVVLSAIVLYIIKREVKDPHEDERMVQISQKSAFRTLEIFWIVFFVISLGSIVWGFDRPGHFRENPPPLLNPSGPGSSVPSGTIPSEGFLFAGNVGFLQLFLLVLMLFLYVGFRFYYARKLGEWETDEE